MLASVSDHDHHGYTYSQSVKLIMALSLILGYDSVGRGLLCRILYNPARTALGVHVCHGLSVARALAPGSYKQEIPANRA